MSITLRLFLLLVLGLLAPQFASAQTATTELAVNGPQGALLLIDGQALGTLPLPTNPVVPSGAHRFRLELGKQKADSDSLTLPAGGQAELNLTLSGRSLVAVLRISDGMLLVLQPTNLPSLVRDSITESVAAAAKAEHSVLLGIDKQSTLRRGLPQIARCMDLGDCHEPIFQEGLVSYVLSVRIEHGIADQAGTCTLYAALLDTRTLDISAKAEESCTAADTKLLTTRISAVTSRLLQETTARARGSLAVTSVPAGAKVLLDDRWLGVTPLQQEAFAGTRTVEVQLDRYSPQKQTVQVEASQSATANIVLARIPSAPLPRPLWRIITASSLAAGGIVMAGFGISALLKNGQCKDPSLDPNTCSLYYQTAGVGGGLFGAGAALVVAGAVMLAIPSPRTHY